VLPPGPSAGVLAQTVRLHRDPLGALRAWRERHGDAFTLRLATARPVVVVCDPAEVEPLLTSDPRWAHAGEARRRILPMASPRSAFGGDEPQHRVARERVAPALAPAAVRARVAPVLHRHPGAFPEPDAFRPERWSDGGAPEATFIPFGGGARRCAGEHLAHAYLDALVPAIVRRVQLRPVWPGGERMVLRGTILVPHRSALVRAA